MVGCKIDFSIQYNQSYLTRYNQMKKLIVASPIFKDYDLPVRKLSELPINTESIVIAILFVESNMKYSILKPEENKQTNTYFNEDSKLLLEDGSGKVHLVFKKTFGKLDFYCSGLVLGFVGKLSDQGIFECSDVIFPDSLKSKQNTDLPASSEKQKSNKILIMSNICVNQNNFEKIKLFLNFYTNNVQEVIILGNIFSNEPEDFDFHYFNQLFIDQACKVTIVPGINDPTCRAYPQAPFHKMLFDSRISNVSFVSNPWQGVLLNRNFVFLNHQIISDILKYDSIFYDNVSNLQDAIHDDMDVIKQIAKTRYITPSCPDTLPSLPYLDQDPFLIDKCDFIIAGGSRESGIFEQNGVFCICVEDFSQSSGCVLLDLDRSVFENVQFSGF